MSVTKTGGSTSPAAPPVGDDPRKAKQARVPDAANQMSAADMAVIESADLFKAIGRIETAHFYEAVSSRLMADQYLKAKDLIGKFGTIAYRDKSGKAKHVSSLEEFCDVFLPLSQRRCQQLARDIALLGPELYDQAQQLGFKARDYQAFKALPEDAQAAVKQAIESGKKEDVLDFLYEMVQRNEALKRDLDDSRQTLVAKNKVLANRDAQLAKYEEEAELPQDVATLAELKNCVLAAQTALMQLGALVQKIDACDVPEELRLLVVNDMEYLAQTHAEILRRGGIPVQFEEMVDPSWLKNISGKRAKGA